MIPTLITVPSQSATTTDFDQNSASTKHFFETRTIVGHAILCVASFLVYLLLNRPEVILLSKLGMTAWYPAAGLVFAVMLAVSPRYMALFALADALAGVLIYHQAVSSWGTLVGAPLGTATYALAAYLLRGPARIDNSLSQRRDVLRYVVITNAAAIFAALTGAACLWLDHTIRSGQFWDSALAWYMGDSIGLVSVAPFLLIHVLPWVRRRIQPSAIETSRQRKDAPKETPSTAPLEILEFSGQAAAFLLVFAIIFRGAPTPQFFYLVFLPVIWIAMRQGIRGAVSGLLVLNFGIVVSLRIFAVSPEVFTRLGCLMLAVSAAGMIMGSAVTERWRIAEHLKERTVFLNSLIENSPFGIVVHGRDGKIQLYNNAFTNLFLYSPSETIGRDVFELTVPASRRAEARQSIQQVNAGNTVHKTTQRLRKDGHLVDVEVHVLPMIQDGEVQGGYALYKDISEQVKASVAAKERADEMSRWVGELQMRNMQITVLNELGGLLQSAKNSLEAYAVVAQSAKKLFVGTHSGALFVRKSSGSSLETAATWGRPCQGDPEFAPHECWSLRLGQPHWSDCPSRDIVCAHVDNSLALNYLCVPMVAQGETLGVLHLQCDPERSAEDPESSQKSQESLKRLAVAAASQIALSVTNIRLRETLRDQSIRDPLTGLFNRRFLQESLDKELQRAKRKQRSVSVIFIDLDHFKRFNDHFGHDAGDSVLQSMADVFRLYFRSEDVICRYGGEEFAVILPETSVQDAAKRAEDLRAATRELKLVHRDVLLDPVTLSIGVAGFPNHGQDAQELLDRADRCLYESKANGRDRVTLANP